MSEITANNEIMKDIREGTDTVGEFKRCDISFSEKLLEDVFYVATP